MKAFDRLVSIMHRLRAPGGCPWDAEQTHQSIKPSLLEEAYEAVEAIEAEDDKALKEELGDILLQVLFHSEMADERKAFSIEDVIDQTSEKLVRRHPHVFAESKVKETKDVLHQWSKIKSEEGRKSVLDGVPNQLPALQQAQRLSEKAARVGFDWESIEHIWSKFDEELAELKEVVPSKNLKRLEDELGDLLTVIVNLARKLDIDAESALRRSSQRFKKRFHYIEESLSKNGRDIHSATLEEMENIWNKAKIALSE